MDRLSLPNTDANTGLWSAGETTRVECGAPHKPEERVGKHPQSDEAEVRVSRGKTKEDEGGVDRWVEAAGTLASQPDRPCKPSLSCWGMAHIVLSVGHGIREVTPDLRREGDRQDQCEHARHS